MSDIIGNNEPLTKISCQTCKHYNREDMKHFSCMAFEDIPKEILSGDNMHSKPLEGQKNNIVYQSKN